MIRIVTDGACSGNPGPGGWAALIIEDGHVEEIGGYEPQTTNNRMEMRAAIEGLKRVPPDAPVVVVTDSQYLKKGITQWLAAWKRRDWVTSTGTPVLNRDLWEELDRLSGGRAQWQYVPGHRGHPENERADQIAQAYSRTRGQEPGNPPPADAAGPPAAEKPRRAAARRTGAAAADGGGRSEAEGTRAAATRERRSAPRSVAPLPPRPFGVSYLSLVDGVLRRDATWPACEARVKGMSGARYKKCRTEAEERETLRSWGVRIDS